MGDDFKGGLYSGTLYASFFLGGAWTGLKKAGNAVKFELKAEADKKDMISKMKETYGQVLKTVTIAKPTSLSISINDPVREILAVGFLGNAETISVVAGTVTDEAHIAPEKGTSIDLDFRDISAVTVTKADASDAVLNTDYIIGVEGGKLGWITLTDDSSITPGEALTIDYSYAARAGYTIKGATQPVCRVRWFLDGENFVDGEPVLIDVFDTQTMPTSPVDFLSDDFQSLELSSTPVTPDGKTYPYLIEYPKAVA